MDKPGTKRTEPESGVDDGLHANGRRPQQSLLASPSPSPSPSPSLSTSPSLALAPPTATTATATTSSKTPKIKAAPRTTPSPPVLVICRNKHWRYISSFHGPWLQLPPEVLETIANANYNTPRPRPIDPAVFFDLVKIRRLVEDATDLAVRAASGVASLNHRGLAGAAHHAASLGLGFGPRPPPQAKLSAERKYKMREQACQKLAEAYRRDEIACSVATMQSASSLDEVASLLLQRSPHAFDAKYVHFFHEKIPSRQVADSTSLIPLDDVIAARPSDPEPLRTRALIRILKGDLNGALDDLTDALRLLRLYRPAAHASPNLLSRDGQSLERPAYSSGRGPRDIILKEDNQPSSLEMQLLFHRAGLYLTIGARCVAGALPGEAAPGKTGAVADQQQPPPVPPPTEKEAQRKMSEIRQLVRQSAKRALRDYTAFLSHLDYSPDMPIEIAEDFTRKVNSAIQGARAPRSHSYPSGGRPPSAGESEDGTPTPHRIFALSDLFASSQPAGLPPFPATDLVLASRAPPSPSPPRPVQTTTETLTGHPLLTEVLHSLLLCHALVQTSSKELLRHAYMVARLTRLADGYPLFQSSRSSARADWMDVVRATDNWIQMAGSWEDLCAPVPLPLFQSAGNGAAPVPIPLSTPNPVKALPAPNSETSPIEPPATTTELIKRPADQQPDTATAADRLTDEDFSLRMAIRARRLRAEHDYRLDSVVAAMDATILRANQGPPDAAASPATTDALAALTTTNGGRSNTPAKPVPKPPSHNAQTNGYTRRRPAQASHYSDEGRDGAASDRALAIARWVLHAPLPNAAGGGAGEGGLRKRRKKTLKKAGGGGGSGAGAGDEDAEGDVDPEEG
ncbi:hypothetical protein C8A05DRAFT_38838 [Staphylotrichum tortipilum]|uniref:Histidine kinase group protein n=1 Tax=Staphylotrichum tortipilum TaxID=2831512 RepID=A0AAN6RP36_9PEZI|nr:hypothetical protein C8A05DRAFT_38838 [Staphylotrichum longicolle]